jgi:hypothetical protein
MSGDIVPWSLPDFEDHANDVIDKRFVCGKWHLDEVANLQALFLGLGDELNANLMLDVRPIDLSIGGLAISRALHHSRYERKRTIFMDNYTDGPTPAVEARINYWATDGDSAVHISNTATWFNDNAIPASLISQLVRQSRGRLLWIPRAEQKRVERIAAVISDKGTIHVSQYGSELDIETARTDPRAYFQRIEHEDYIRVDDETVTFDPRRIIIEAQMLAYLRHGWKYIGKNKPKDREPTPEEAAKLAIDSYSEQDHVQLTPSEIVNSVDFLVHSRISELSHKVEILKRAVLIVVNGRRLRPAEI